MGRRGREAVQQKFSVEAMVTGDLASLSGGSGVIEIQIGGAILAGLLIGSFLNVCIFRLPRDLSVVRPARSFCPGCEKTIAWYDNIPVVSYILLGGRCRHCKTRIPLRYPIVELATAAAFGLCVAALG